MRTARDHAQALTINALAAKLTADQATKLDYVANTQRVGFYHNGGEDFGVSIDMPGDEIVTLAVEKNAHEQIGGRIGIPRKYYERMGKDAPDLLVQNVQHWLAAEPEKRMFRALHGNLRAVVSDRYRRLDNYDLMEHLLPELQKVEGLDYWVTALTPERMYIRATLPRLRADVKVGDTVQAGIEISNSEIGHGSLQVRPWLLRLDCLNGMTTKVAIRKYHAGRRVEETEDVLGIFRDETLAADDKAFFMKAADMARAALSDVTFGQIVEQLRATATGVEIEKPVDATVVLSQKLDLTPDEGQTVLSFLASGGDLSQWGAINALTETAKSAESFGRLSELEAKAGELAEWDAKEWERVAVAA